ncbi:MAG: DegT/DnrJ/EryC1/StrS family aminotransferase [Spirochaetota bacterium]
MINVSRPSIRRRDMDAVLSCMVTDSLGPGSLSDQLSTAVGDYLGLAGGIALRERARAFAIAVGLLDLEPGSRVLLDPLVPHAYHAVLHELGLVPVYVDVSEDSLCIDAERAEAFVETSRGTEAEPAAIVTHTTLGFVPAMESLAALGLPVIEDVSEGIGANTGEERVGRFGRFVIVGMEPEDVITAGGGTVLLASSKSDRTALRRRAEELSADALLPDMNAALGLTQIREIEKFVARRAEIASVYARALMRGRHRSPVQPGDGQNVYLSFPVLAEGSVSDVVSYAKKKGVEARQAFSAVMLARYGLTEREVASPAHATAAGGAASGQATAVAPAPAPDPTAPSGVSILAAGPPTVAEADFPVARSLLLRCLVFPLYPSLTAKEVATIERVLTTLP